MKNASIEIVRRLLFGKEKLLDPLTSYSFFGPGLGGIKAGGVVPVGIPVGAGVGRGVFFWFFPTAELS